MRRRYGNEPVRVNGLRFDSKAEARRYAELRLLEQAGEIRDLTLQPVFELAPAVVLDGRRKPCIRYVGDFAYYVPRGPGSSQWRQVVEDVKGATRTDRVYRLKRHLLKVVHGIDVVEVA